MNQDFVDLLRAFIARDVRFLVVGAYALGVHGRPRATSDLDVWVEPTPENAERVMRALADFFAPWRGGCSARTRCARPMRSSWHPRRWRLSTGPHPSWW
jgi:hypothetical protein